MSLARRKGGGGGGGESKPSGVQTNVNDKNFIQCTFNVSLMVCYGFDLDVYVYVMLCYAMLGYAIHLYVYLQFVSKTCVMCVCMFFSDCTIK